MSNRGVRRGGGRARAVARAATAILIVGVISGAGVSISTSVSALPTARSGASTISAVSWSDDADPALDYTGAWTATSVGGERMMMLSASGSVEYSFVGTSVSWIGVRSPGAGIVDVLLDDARIATIDGYGQSAVREILFHTAGLSDTAHSLRLVSTGRHHARATGSGVTVAGFSAAAVPAPTVPAPAVPEQPTVDSVLGRAPLDVDPGSQVALAITASGSATRAALAPISAQPLATWFGDWNTDVASDVRARVAGADARGTVATLVMYAIPHRDCGGYSAGTVMTADRYRAWVAGFVEGLGSSRHLVIVEPDALLLTGCLSAAERTERSSLLRSAVEAVAAQGSTAYLDAGHSAWGSAPDTVDRLRAAGIESAAGFSLNVSNTQPTAREIAHGSAISALLGGTHFVIDTGRNGGSVAPGEWCNPMGAGLGAAPTTETASPLVDAYLWVKPPGESDGTCNGGPVAGRWFETYARMLVQNSPR